MPFAFLVSVVIFLGLRPSLLLTCSGRDFVIDFVVQLKSYAISAVIVSVLSWLCTICIFKCFILEWDTVYVVLLLITRVYWRVDYICFLHKVRCFVGKFIRSRRCSHRWAWMIMMFVTWSWRLRVQIMLLQVLPVLVLPLMFLKNRLVKIL